LHTVRNEVDVGKDERLTAWNGAVRRDPGPDGRWRWFWGDLVDGAIDVLDERGQVVDVVGPDIAPSRLLNSVETARLLGWTAGTGGTLAANLSRGRMVPPVLLVGQCQAWALPQLRWFLANRPFRVRDWYPDRG